ncbi:MAG: hypothetical protein DCF19_19605 [Pseudanabaena frigida]|uniref:Uncharacterized protein n=1 Tax=Pseudanabaena frigida TaxID=945775 RepID=A0A2W4W121_9CYAN|nr:MAG: hypothetical protein DCF19_19605 [Pseudanabaena frigida]
MRKPREQVRNRSSIIGVIDKKVLIQALEQDSILNSEEDFVHVFSNAHVETTKLQAKYLRCYC